MTTYYATYAGLLLAVILGGQGRDVRKVLYWAVLIGLFLFSGFRFQVGCDWTGYLNNWGFWRPGGSLNPWEQRDPAHWALIDALKGNGLPYVSLNVATSAIFFAGLHIFARTQPNPLAIIVMAFPILIINMPMSGIRQAVAIGFVSAAYVAFEARRTGVFLALILAGAMFHSSALVFLLLLPFIHGSYSRKTLLMAGLLAAPGAYFMFQSDSAELAASRYIDSGVEAAGSAFRLALLALTGLFYFTLLQKRWKRMFPQDYELATISALLMVSFFGLFFVSTVIGDRFGYYLIPLQLMIFARVPYLFSGDNRLILGLAPYALLTLVFVVWTQMSWHFQNCYIPYRTVL